MSKLTVKLLSQTRIANWKNTYYEPGKVVAGKLGYFQFRKNPLRRFSQPALLMDIHALIYGPGSTHRNLLPRLKDFVHLDA